MAMGMRDEHQNEMWVAAVELPRSPGHPFYDRLNRLLDSHGFDAFVEKLCRKFYAAEGRPSVPPGRYFRLLMLGYFEGIDSERGISWRASDSLAIRSFLGLALDESAPDHSTLSRTRRRIDLETHRAVFTWVLERVAGAGLLVGKTIGVDATTLEANAAMRSIVRRDTGESYNEFLTKLAKESGIETPTREDIARLDRRRGKGKASNDDWKSPTDPDAKITKMKDGRTHLAHKAEQAVDLDTGALVAITLLGADQDDKVTIEKTVEEAENQIEKASAAEEEDDARIYPRGMTEIVADKGYHSDDVLVALEARGLRSYISEPKRKRRNWEYDVVAQDAVYANRRRIKGERGKRLQRLRGERLERPFAHLYDTGGMRRTHLRGHENILKRQLVHASGFNLGLLLRKMIGVGKPRLLQGVISALLAALLRYWSRLFAATFQPAPTGAQMAALCASPC